VLRVDEGADAALLLGFGDGLERQRGLAGGFGPVDLDDAAAGEPADAERDVEAERARRDRLDLDHLLVLAEPHDRTLAEGTLDLAEGGFEGFLLVHIALVALINELNRWFRHSGSPYSMLAKAKQSRVNVPVLFSWAREILSA